MGTSSEMLKSCPAVGSCGTRKPASRVVSRGAPANSPTVAARSGAGPRRPTSTSRHHVAAVARSRSPPMRTRWESTAVAPTAVAAPTTGAADTAVPAGPATNAAPVANPPASPAATCAVASRDPRRVHTARTRARSAVAAQPTVGDSVAARSPPPAIRPATPHSPARPESCVAETSAANASAASRTMGAGAGASGLSTSTEPSSTLVRSSGVVIDMVLPAAVVARHRMGAGGTSTSTSSSPSTSPRLEESGSEISASLRVWPAWIRTVTRTECASARVMENTSPEKNFWATPCPLPHIVAYWWHAVHRLRRRWSTSGGRTLTCAYLHASLTPGCRHIGNQRHHCRKAALMPRPCRRRPVPSPFRWFACLCRWS